MSPGQPAYCTILARNYLPVALALAESLRSHGDGTPLAVMLIDADEDEDLPDVPGIRWMHPGMLGLGDRTVLELAMSYDLVEFATAVKPPLLSLLLREHEQVAYLDPDTWVVSPMNELTPALRESEGGIVLTPHFLDPVPAESQFSDGHALQFGVYNLGFCAVDRRAEAFLDWWWGHLRGECLVDPLSGLFVDQKWVDLGSVLFAGTALRHRGYNNGFANLHERPLARDADGYHIAGTDDRLRLFHFHSFDLQHPEKLSKRFRTSHPEGFDASGLGSDPEALAGLSGEYAMVVTGKQREMGPAPPYRFASDTAGRRIPRGLRRAYRVEALARPGELPSPFVPAEAESFERWRRGARRQTGRLLASDVAKGMRFALPDQYEKVKNRLPGLTASLRGRFIEKGGMWE